MKYTPRYWGFVAFRAHRDWLLARNVPCRAWEQLSEKERKFWIIGANQ